MKYLLLLAALISASSTAHAAEPKLSVESEAIVALLSACLEPLAASQNPADVATSQKLTELPKESAELLAGTGSRVFVIRPATTMLAALPHGCSVMLYKMNFESFKKEAELAFGDDSEFKLSSQKAEEDSVTREYAAAIDNVGYTLVISARKKPEKGHVQAVMTIGKSQ